MVSRRRDGMSALGCLVTLLLVVAAAYFAFNIGVVHLRHYQFKDAMAQEARFAGRTSNPQIIRRLQAKADSLGLPEEAQIIRIRRAANRITIWTDYIETVEFPLFVRQIRFTPQVETQL